MSRPLRSPSSCAARRFTVPKWRGTRKLQSVNMSNRGAVILTLSASLCLPLNVFAETVQCTNSYSGTQVRTYTLPQGTQNPGQNQFVLQRSLQGDTAGAQRDIEKTFFTTELTSFNDRTCSDGPCRNNIAGIAHRSWPLNSCVAVCRTNSNGNGPCAIAIVMDRGPNESLRCRTIDANPALQAILGMRGGTISATYQLLSLPPKHCDTTATPPNFSVPEPAISTSHVSSPGASPFGVGLQPSLGAYPSQGAHSGQNAYAGYGASSAYGASSVLGQQASPFTAAPTSGASGASDGTTSGNLSAATIIVQPQNISRGSTYLVSWASVNMQSSTCKVTRNGAEFGTGSEGTNRDIMRAAGTTSYVFECKNAAGTAVRSTASVSIN